MTISIPRVCSLALIALTLLLTKTGQTQQVVGISGFLQSTNADEIDGWSETDMDYYTAYYYDAAAIGYLFQGQTQVDARASQAGNPWAGVETTSSTRQGSVYTVYSEHYLIAYYTFSDGTFYNPYQYPGGSYFSSPGGGDPSGTGYGYGGGYTYITEDDIYLGYTYTQISTAPPSINSISPNSDGQGSTGTIHVQGQNLRDDLGVLNAAFRDGAISVSVGPNPSSTQADLSYTVSSTAAIGAHQLVLSNTWGESEPVTFTVPATSTGPGVLNPQQASCPTMLDAHTGFSSVAFAGAGTGGSGSMAVSFSGGSFNGYSASVPYGPYSTPESIASHLAALITKSYANSGLSAEAYGAYLLYKGNATLGNVGAIGSGSAFTTDPSPQGCPPVSINLRLVPVVSRNEPQGTPSHPSGTVLLHNVWRLVTLAGGRATLDYRVVEHIGIMRSGTEPDGQGGFQSPKNSEEPAVNIFNDGIGCLSLAICGAAPPYYQKFTIKQLNGPNRGITVPVLTRINRQDRPVLIIHEHGANAPTINEGNGPLPQYAPDPYNQKGIYDNY